MIQLISFFLIVFHAVFGMHKPSSKEPSLGVQTIEYFDEERQRPVVVEFWYPAEAQTRGVSFSENSPWIHPKESRDASFSKVNQKYPLILFSHGHQGERRDLSWLADRLVRHGYCVAAIDHDGDMRGRFDIQKSVRFWNRSIDFSFLLNQLEKDESLKEKIDFSRVGFVGYSLGGMTGLQLAGAKASHVKELVYQLNGKFDSWSNDQFDEVDFSESERSYLESRIKGFCLLCPASYPYSKETLKEVISPIALVVSVGDEVLPFEEHGFRLIRYLVPKKLKVLGEEVSHYAFQNPLSELGKKILTKHLPEKVVRADRSSVHQEVSRFATEFFRETFESDQAFESR